MKLLKRKPKKPALRGNAAVLHIALTAALPLLTYILIRLDFAWVAVVLLFISKWRMFTIHMRHWPAIFRSNAVDIFFGLAMIVFMFESGAQSVQFMWVIVYTVWLVLVKPKSSPIWVGVQAIIAQSFALVAAFLLFQEASTLTLVFTVWTITYLCARHFLTAFDESMSRGTAYAWAFFCACIGWLSSRWLIFYGPIAQPALLLTVLGYGLASMYYLDHRDKLTVSLKRHFVMVMTALVLFLIVFSDWSDKTI